MTIEFTHVAQGGRRLGGSPRSCTHAVLLGYPALVELLRHVCVFHPHRRLSMWTAGAEHSHVRPRDCHTSTLLFHAHGGACTVLECPFKSLHHCPYQCFALFQAATHCQHADCWQRPIAGPTNWNQLQQQAVSWDSWQRYEGLDWASPVQQGPAGEEGWVLHHWSRVTVMDRFREERWWPRFFSCLDSVWKDGHDGRRVSKSNSVSVRVCARVREGDRESVSACACMSMNACSRVLTWLCMGVKWSNRAPNVKSDTEILQLKLVFRVNFGGELILVFYLGNQLLNSL